MARQIVVHTADGAIHLTEGLADNEAQLQEQLMTHSELVPLEEFGLEGPMMVIGREASLPSGAADLMGLAYSGDIVIVEFKTGPQNTDFRHTLAQLLDYGADVWSMDPDAFEALARRYFQGDRCPSDDPVRGAETLADAARRTWAMGDEELAQFSERWRQSLEAGDFHYVVAAQRFTSAMERTIQYLNYQCRTARFYAVELVRFVGGGMEAFEARSVVKAGASRGTAPGSITEVAFLEGFPAGRCQDAVRELLDFARAQQLVIARGSRGVTLRVRVPEASEPLSIAWLSPPGVPGWAGLHDINFGHDTWRAERDIPDSSLLQQYLAALGAVAGVVTLESASVKGYQLPCEVLVEHRSAVLDAIGQLVRGIGDLS